MDISAIGGGAISKAMQMTSVSWNGKVISLLFLWRSNIDKTPLKSFLEVDRRQAGSENDE